MATPHAHRVTRGQIVARGLTLRCPNCGERTLFPSAVSFRLARTCTSCALPFERDEGSFLGAVALNYGITTVAFLVPTLFLYLGGVVSGLTASILALAGAFLVPLLLYRPSRSWWLMNYYLVLPHLLPANAADETSPPPA